MGAVIRVEMEPGPQTWRRGGAYSRAPVPSAGIAALGLGALASLCRRLSVSFFIH